MTKIYLANVGVNRSDEKRGMMNPLFEDNTFEFIPIKENKRVKGNIIPTYETLKAYNSDLPLANYLPEKIHNYYAHNDPEFITFTYGDMTKNSRSRNLLKIEKDDYLFFLVRLTPYRNNQYIKLEGNFYLIGFFQIEGIYKTEQKIEENSEKLKENAHYKKYITDYEEIDSSFIIKGDIKKSKRFKYPIRVDRSFCNKFLTDIDGREYKWKNDLKFDNQVIGSYTRTIRSILDSEKEPEKFQKFISYIEERSIY